MSIESQPRFRLATLPTPLHDAVRLREALGGPRVCPRILIKRDDLTGLALGGNKARKLEYLVADALQAGATVLVTTGAVQSNHARMTAAAARIAGMKSVLVLSSREPDPAPQGNLLLDYLLGAEVRFVPPGPDPKLAAGNREDEVLDDVLRELSNRGERPYLIPVGGSSPIGALGYVVATLELVLQLRDLSVAPSRLYYANGSRGTQAGLALGAKMYSAPYRLYGVAVSGGGAEKTQRALRIASEAASLVGVAARVTAEDLPNDPGYLGPGYGVPTPECLEAIRILAQTEGILLDPVYTGKVMAALIDHVRSGVVGADETVIFLHTGGAPALFAYAGRLDLPSQRSRN